jgi:hypothetical protein
MGLLRGVARTAVVAGTATAVSNGVSRRQAGRWARQEEQASQQQAMAQPMSMDERVAHLQSLAELKEQGYLTDAEFEQQKAAILAS